MEDIILNVFLIINKSLFTAIKKVPKLFQIATTLMHQIKKQFQNIETAL